MDVHQHHRHFRNDGGDLYGYPRILDQRLEPAEWLGAYVRTYVDRDVRLISNIGDLAAFQRFVQLCASRTGQLLNLSSLALDAGIAQPTAKAWLSILEATFIVFRLQPYFANIGKRLVKTPKLHFYDTGLACWLLGIRETEQLRLHPLRGAIFESWVVAPWQTPCGRNKARPDERVFAGLHRHTSRAKLTTCPAIA